MKFNQIALLCSLFFTCQLASSTSSGLSDKQAKNSLSPGLNSEPGNANSFFSTPGISPTVDKTNLQKEYYLEVLKLLKGGEFDTAENKIDSLLKQFPDEDHFYILQATLELYKQSYSLAIKSYQKAIKLNPNNISSQLGIAKIFLILGDFGQARKHANNALSINNNLVYPYFLLAEVADKENRQQDIEELLLTAQKKVRGNSRQELMVAEKLVDFYIMRKQAEKALNVAQDLIKKHPDNSSAFSLLASVQFFNNRPEQAISTLEKLISHDSQDIRHRLLLAKLSLTHTGDEQQALKLLSEINLIAPNNIHVQAQRAVIFTQLKQYPEALQTAKKVKQLAPGAGLAETLEGEIYLAEKKMKLALSAFHKSYKIKPAPKVLNIIIDLLVTQGKQTDAVQLLEGILQRKPKNLTAHFKLANIYQQQNKNNKAIKHYQAIIAEQPDNALILNNLAWIYHQENNPRDLEFARRAYRKAPNSADIADTYAIILIKQGELAKGLEIFQKAAKRAPDNYDIQYHLANAYVLKGDTKRAMNILKKITHPERNFSEKEAAISLLSKLE